MLCPYTLTLHLSSLLTLMRRGGVWEWGKETDWCTWVTIHISWTEIVTHSWACAQGNIVPQKTLCQLPFGTDPRLFDSSRKDNEINLLTLHVCIQCTSAFSTHLHLVHICIQYTSAFNAHLHSVHICIQDTCAFSVASFPGLVRSSLAVKNSCEISYCKRLMRKAWEWGYTQCTSVYSMMMPLPHCARTHTHSVVVYMYIPRVRCCG